MNGHLRRFCLLVTAILGAAVTAQANVRLPAIIGNNMVLQRDLALPFWGFADPGEDVTVTLGEATATTKADGSGRWTLKLPAMPKAGGPYDVVIKGKNEIKLTNVLVGEVWAGSGQSNMQWNVAQSKDAPAEIAAAKFPKIRLFIIPLVPSGTPNTRGQRAVGRMLAADGPWQFGGLVLLRSRNPSTA
jgi:sialate O-acetylesterase